MTNDIGVTVEINEKYTRMGEIHSSDSSVEIATLGFQETAPLFFASESQGTVEKEAEVLERLHSNLKLKKRNTRIIIPDNYTYSRVLEMPRLKEKELLAAIRYQADEFIPMAIEETNLDLEILKDDEKNNKMLIFIVASPKKLVEQIQQTFEMADLIPESLESELSAVARVVAKFLKAPSPQDPTTAGTTILINFGYSSSSLYLFDKASSMLLLSRSFKIGLNLFIKDLMVNLNIDEAKATEILKTLGTQPNASVNLETIIGPIVKELSKEIERFILISKDRYSLAVTEMYIFNFDNSIAGLNAKLQESIAMPINSLTLAQVIADNPIKQSFSASLSSFVSVIAGSL